MSKVAEPDPLWPPSDPLTASIQARLFALSRAIDAEIVILGALKRMGPPHQSTASDLLRKHWDFVARFTVADMVSAGSSLKFCRVASGDADLYPRLGRTMEWDTAAGDAVLRAAGGRVCTMDGQALTYGKRNQGHDVDYANPWFIAAGRFDPLQV